MSGGAGGRLAVTGATGRVGSRVATALALAGREQTLLVRDPSRAPALAGAQVRQASYGIDARAALVGAKTLLMVSAAEVADRVDQHRAFIDAAAAAGVQHVVYTSFVGAAGDSTFSLGRDHWATEQHLRVSGMSWTFLRDNLYADFLPLMVGADGTIRGPAGEGRLSAVAIDDVADVATVVLCDPAAHAGEAYALTGPGAITLREAAALITEYTGREVRFVDETLEQAYASRSTYGAPDWQLEAWVSTYTAIAAGEMATVSDDVARITGHRATSFRQLLAAESAG